MPRQPGSSPIQYRKTARSVFLFPALLMVGLLLTNCSPVSPAPDQSSGAGSTTSQANTATIPMDTQVSPSETPPGIQPVTDANIHIAFVDLTDGGTLQPEFDADGRMLVNLRVEVSGMTPMFMDLTANGMPVMDSTGHRLVVNNPTNTTPFTGEFPWSPANGGGAYTLVVGAMDANKLLVQGTITITVAGPAFTATPPPLTMTQAQQRFSSLLLSQYGVSLPMPAVQRFDFPENPTRSRWTGSAYFQGTRYYIDIFDDTRFTWANNSYSDPAQKVDNGQYVICRPLGTYKVLTIFVDYGNTDATRSEVLAKVPVVVDWLNGLYSSFATSQGFSAPLLKIEADAAYISPPPAPGEFLTASQISSLTGKNPAKYDFLMQIDMDSQVNLANRYFPGLLSAGGGIALQGCGNGDVKYNTIINIWSSISAASSVENGLIMDFNHELSHLFGMEDSWAYLRNIPGPDGLTVDDWIPYVMFGWTDTDGDGIPEIQDPTPYGSSGPIP